MQKHNAACFFFIRLVMTKNQAQNAHFTNEHGLCLT